MEYNVSVSGTGFALSLDGRRLISHSAERPALFVGRGNESITMFRGNFDVRDRVWERIALRFEKYEGGTLRFSHPDINGAFTVSLEERGGLL